MRRPEPCPPSDAGEADGEARPATEEAEADESCRRIPPPELKSGLPSWWSAFQFQAVWDSNGKGRESKRSENTIVCARAVETSEAMF